MTLIKKLKTLKTWTALYEIADTSLGAFPVFLVCSMGPFWLMWLTWAFDLKWFIHEFAKQSFCGCLLRLIVQSHAVHDLS